MKKIKDLFSTPKKAVCFLVCVLCVIAVIEAGAVYVVGVMYWSRSSEGTEVKKDTEVKSRSDEDTVQELPETTTTPENRNSYIGVDKAKSIAVSHAGFSLSEVTFSKAKFEDDDGYMVYEVEFYRDGREYEYTIDASEGTILEYESEQDD